MLGVVIRVPLASKSSLLILIPRHILYKRVVYTPYLRSGCAELYISIFSVYVVQADRIFNAAASRSTDIDTANNAMNFNPYHPLLLTL